MVSSLKLNYDTYKILLLKHIFYFMDILYG